jgi:thioredoxin-like negative regulator of GroEL
MPTRPAAGRAPESGGENVERLGSDAFEGTRLRRAGTWAVVFLADWCPFCRAFEPKFQALDGAGNFQLAVADLTDYDSPLWERFEVGVVPTVVVFRDGAPDFRQNGRMGIGLRDSDLSKLRANLGLT